VNHCLLAGSIRDPFPTLVKVSTLLSRCQSRSSDAVGFDLGDDDDVLVVERVPGADGDDHDPVLEIASEDASLGGQKRGRQSSDIWELFTDDVNRTGRSLPSASFPS
jgi:hypothetical protein